MLWHDVYRRSAGSHWATSHPGSDWRLSWHSYVRILHQLWRGFLLARSLLCLCGCICEHGGWNLLFSHLQTGLFMYVLLVVLVLGAPLYICVGHVVWAQHRIAATEWTTHITSSLCLSTLLKPPISMMTYMYIHASSLLVHSERDPSSPSLSLHHTCMSVELSMICHVLQSDGVHLYPKPDDHHGDTVRLASNSVISDNSEGTAS